MGISLDEFTAALQDVTMSDRCATLGLDIKDAKLFFCTLAERYNVEALEIDILVNLCTRLRGVAQSVDLQAVEYATQKMQGHLEHLAMQQERIFEVLGQVAQFSI